MKTLSESAVSDCRKFKDCNAFHRVLTSDAISEAGATDVCKYEYVLLALLDEVQ